MAFKYAKLMEKLEICLASDNARHNVFIVQVLIGITSHTWTCGLSYCRGHQVHWREEVMASAIRSSMAPGKPKRILASLRGSRFLSGGFSGLTIAVSITIRLFFDTNLIRCFSAIMIDPNFGLVWNAFSTTS